jgi:hypothetical protein
VRCAIKSFLARALPTAIGSSKDTCGLRVLATRVLNFLARASPAAIAMGSVKDVRVSFFVFCFLFLVGCSLVSCR